MASRAKPDKFEMEMEKQRSNRNWDRAIEMARHPVSKATAVNGPSLSLEVYTNLLMGEKILETYLQCNATDVENVDKARKELEPVVKHFRFVIRNCPENKEYLKQEAVMLLGKALFTQALYEEALQEFNAVNIDAIKTVQISNRVLKIYAEGLAVKAMCMEKQDKNIEKIDLILKLYEQAGDLTMVYLQNRDSQQQTASPATTMTLNAHAVNGAANTGGNTVSSYNDTIGSILETCIQKSPLIYIENKQRNKCVGRFRELMRAVESRTCKNLHRLTLARQLAEVLLRGVCSETYPPMSTTASTDYQSTFKARKYECADMFVPSNEEEEALLLLLIAESHAVKEAVLERRPEHTASRQHAYDNNTAVYDLLAICLTRRGNIQLLNHSLEQAMKFSYEEFHVWYQFGLTLVNLGKYERAVCVFKECHRLKTDDVTIPMMISNILYQYLHRFDDGIGWAAEAVRISTSSLTESKGHLLVGIGCDYKSMECRVEKERNHYTETAYQNFVKACNLDSYNIEALFRLSLHQARQHQLSDAYSTIREVLKSQPEHHNALALHVLILSAKKKYDQALVCIEFALKEYPESLSLMLIKSKLESNKGNRKQALSTCAEMLKLWKKFNQCNQPDGEDKFRGTGLIDKFTTCSDSRSLLLFAESQHQDNGSYRESIAASKVEQALSEIISTSYHWTNSLWTSGSTPSSLNTQSYIWLHIAEIYMDHELYQESLACVNEAAAFNSLSHQVSYMKGRVLELQCRFSEAITQLEAALSINPYHVNSMTYLGKCHLMLNNKELAEKTLRDAVRTDPNNHHAWRELGVTLDSTSDFDTASECFITSINLEKQSPIIPYSFLLHNCVK